MTIKARIRPAHARRSTTRLSESRLNRRSSHPVIRRAQARPVSHWIASREGRPVRVWRVQGRRALSPNDRGSDA
jgi:hypothetical protein